MTNFADISEYITVFKQFHTRNCLAMCNMISISIQINQN